MVKAKLVLSALVFAAILLMAIAQLRQGKTDDSELMQVRRLMNYLQTRIEAEGQPPSSVKPMVADFSQENNKLDIEIIEIPWKDEFANKDAVPLSTVLRNAAQGKSNPLLHGKTTKAWIGYSVSHNKSKYLIAGADSNGRWVPGLAGVPYIIRP